MTKKKEEVFSNRLSWGNSLISQYDIDMLEPNEWLGDGFIDFWLQICKSLFEETQSENQKQSFDCWPPSLVELMSMIEPGMSDGLLPNLTDVIFLPISNRYESNARGSHWSLLVLSIPNEQAYHFDSCSGLNLSAAKSVLKQFKSIFKDQLRETDITLKSIKVKDQKNGYDCGIYVLVFSYYLSIFFASSSSDLESHCNTLSNIITPDFVCKSRESISCWIFKWREIEPEQRKKMKLLKEVNDKIGKPLKDLEMP